ncbi:MAG: DUF1318 domain-containing protein [Desulfuromonadales bacterium]|nr:DUF1318 domain-containing protein [Desulfuromonadales bacterium]
MKTKCIKWFLAGLCALLAACAIITVNVYFPEKAVKEAYKSLDDMLLKNSDKQPAVEKQPATEKQPADTKPQSSLINELPSISLCSVAQAAEKGADELAVEMAGMPEVVKAYDEMSRRWPRLAVLFDSAAVGLTSQGLVAVRDKTKVSAQDEALINLENQNRKTVVGSMAKAILRINKVKESKAALDQVLGKAATTYAETKREAAKPGWWYQLPNGRWLQK